MDGIGAIRKQKDRKREMKQRSLAGIRPGMLLLFGMHRNHWATKVLHYWSILRISWICKYSINHLDENKIIHSIIKYFYLVLQALTQSLNQNKMATYQLNIDYWLNWWLPLYLNVFPECPSSSQSYRYHLDFSSHSALVILRPFTPRPIFLFPFLPLLHRVLRWSSLPGCNSGLPTSLPKSQ